MATHNRDQIDDGHYHHWIENNCKAIEKQICSEAEHRDCGKWQINLMYHR